jgi:hypothetical protein
VLASGAVHAVKHHVEVLVAQQTAAALQTTKKETEVGIAKMDEKQAMPRGKPEKLKESATVFLL